MDQEEECIEILETTSMDEEYRMLQSDLCFYQLMDSGKQDPGSRKSSEGDTKKSHNNRATIMLDKICVPIEYENDVDDTETPIIEEPKTIVPESETPTPTQSTTTAPTIKKSEEKNEVMFKSFFGATKNAIFRTAQSIIDNHEKKSSKNKENKEENVKSPTEMSKKKEFCVLRSKNKNSSSTTTLTPETTPEVEVKSLSKSSSTSSLKVPGVAVAHSIQPKDKEVISQIKTERGQSGLLRFFESPVFNIHFAVHYLFYSKEPGVLSFIGNKIFSFPDIEVDLYIPQLIVMYIQMEELTEVLDPYLVYRCRKSADFSLKCIWLLEAYNYNSDSMTINQHSGSSKKHLALMKELYPKRERQRSIKVPEPMEHLSPVKKTHHRSQSDATGLLGSLHLSTKLYHTPSRLCLGDLSTGRAFDNGCVCFESVRGTVNDLLGQQTVCCCGAPKLTPEKEFMKSLIDIGKMLTVLQTKIEKTSRLRILLNLINKNLPARVWLPLHSETPHHVVRITEEKTVSNK